MKPSLAFGIKTLLIVAAAVGLAFLFDAARQETLRIASPEPAAPAPENVPASRDISLNDAEVLYRSGQAVFLDARDPDLYEGGHIEGALSLPPFAFTREFPAIRDRLERKTVITYCDGEFCELSHELAEQLSAAGVPGVRVLRNGWALWRGHGLPTAAGPVPAPDAGMTDMSGSVPPEDSAPVDSGQAGMHPARDAGMSAPDDQFLTSPNASEVP
ncbi:MAG: rhodanese-like domain-containing protein [Pseudomonadota bacterium]|nr:rhodanese-like domain-containing protein [Pseudomonadota bacterium]